MELRDIFKWKKKTPIVEQRAADVTMDNNLSMQLLFEKTRNKSSNDQLSAFYACLALISNTIAQLPIKVSIVSEDGEKTEDCQNPIYIALHCGLMNKYNLMKNLIKDLYMKGNAYAYIQRGNGGLVTDVIYCQPGDVTVNYDENKRKLTYTLTKLKKTNVPMENVIHLQRDNIDGINGRAISLYAQKVLDLAASTDGAASSYFSSGCNVNGVLTMANPISDKQRQQIISNWQQTYGSGSSGGVAVLGAGASYQPIAQSAAQSQMLESREHNVAEICRFFLVPPPLIGDLTHTSFATLEQLNLQFLLYVISPLVNLIQEEFNRKLVGIEDLGKIVIDLKEEYILKGDKASTADFYTKLVNSGVMTRNEVRKELGYSPMEGCDDLIIPYTDTNMNKVGKSDNEEA